MARFIKSINDLTVADVVYILMAVLIPALIGATAVYSAKKIEKQKIKCVESGGVPVKGVYDGNVINCIYPHQNKTGKGETRGYCIRG